MKPGISEPRLVLGDEKSRQPGYALTGSEARLPAQGSRGSRGPGSRLFTGSKQGTKIRAETIDEIDKFESLHADYKHQKYTEFTKSKGKSIFHESRDKFAGKGEMDRFQTVDAGRSDMPKHPSYIHETSLVQPSESLQISELNQSQAKEVGSTLPDQKRAKWEICENLRMLNLFESQEQVKRKSLEKYIGMYANIQAKKQRSTSPG